MEHAPADGGGSRAPAAIAGGAAAAGQDAPANGASRLASAEGAPVPQEAPAPGPDVVGLAVRAGRPVAPVPPSADPFPGLDRPEAIAAWRSLVASARVEGTGADALPTATVGVLESFGARVERPALYVRFEDEAMPLAEVRRLATLADVWVDARPQAVGDCLDLAIAGAVRIAVRREALGGELDDALAEMGEALLLWSTPRAAAADAARVAPFGAGLLLDGEPDEAPPCVAYVVRATGAGRFKLHPVGRPPQETDEEDPGGGDEDEEG